MLRYLLQNIFVCYSEAKINSFEDRLALYLNIISMKHNDECKK